MDERYTRYIENLRRVRALARPEAHAGMKAADLLEEIKQNAAESYTLMQQSNAILDEVIFSRRAENLTEEEAAGLSEFAGKLFHYANSEDCGIAYKIHALLLDYARLKQDDRAIIRELYWAGVTMHYMNVRSDDSSINPLGKQVRGYFQEGASYMARYEGFDLETKSYIIRCLGNSRMAMSRHSHADCEAYMEVFDKAMGVIRSPYYRKLDPSIPWDKFEYAMHADRMTLLAYLRDFKDPEIAEKVLESAEYIHREQAKNQTDDERLQNWRLGYFYAMARYHAGRCPVREVVDVLLEAIEKADPKDYSPTGINNNLTSLSSLFYYEAALPSEEKPQYACRLEKMFSKSVSYLNDLPVNQYPRVASNAVRELVEMQAGAERPYRKNMLVYMLAAHKPTYVHSLMVANLTRFFVRRLLWKKPEAMVGTMGYDTVEAVRQHAEELCVMAYECGVYHDIGKSMVTMYVGNNSRRLLDEEFVCVQWHAAFGYELLCKIGHKGDLALAALYHHTYYDGQGGYPKDQPPCPKNMKPIVDALTVADSSGRGHRQHRAVLHSGKAAGKADRGAAGPKGQPLRPGGGGAVRRPGFLHRVSAQTVRVPPERVSGSVPRDDLTREKRQPRTRLPFVLSKSKNQFSEEISWPKYFSPSSERVPSARSSSMALLMASSRVAVSSPLRRGMATWEASSVNATSLKSASGWTLR